MQETLICHCMGVSRQDIFTAVDKGSCSIDQLADCTEATLGCGTCVNEVFACMKEALATFAARKEAQSCGQKIFPFIDS